MHILRPGTDVDAYFEALNGADDRLLLLDYDGTLAPFRTERDQAVPYAGVAEILGELQRMGKTRIVVITGRSIDDLLRVFDFARTLEIWGSHGAERRIADGRVERDEISDDISDALAAAFEFARQSDAMKYCEQKPVSIALHWRGLDEATIETLKAGTVADWTKLAAATRLKLNAFDGGVELRAPGRNKGDAVRVLRSEMSSEVALAYLGDDLTDEDAFAALQERDLGVLVREQLRPTRAAVWIRPPAELLEFLERWRLADVE